MARDICGAKAKSTGKPCKRGAGWGTDHPGTGRCKLHGGRSRKGAEHGSFKHGQDSKYFDASEIVGFDEWEATVGPQLQLERHLLGMIYILQQWVVKQDPVIVNTSDGPRELPLDPRTIASAIGAVSQAHDRLVKQRQGETIHVRLAQPEVERAFGAVAEAIVEHVEDPALAQRLGDAIADALDGIGGAGA